MTPPEGASPGNGPRVPIAQSRPWRRLGQGSEAQSGINFAPGGVFNGGGILWALIPVFGANGVAVRIKATQAGTIALLFVGPDFAVGQPAGTPFLSLTGTVYSTGNPPTQAVAANTETIIQANTAGEGYILVKFTAGATAGTITYCDVAQGPKAASSATNIGAVTIMDPTSGAEAPVKAPAAMAETDNALEVGAPIFGLTTDAAVVGDNAGTISAKLRGLGKILNDIWVSASHYFSVGLYDGTNRVAIKAASTAPAAADPALVVGISPNSPVGTKGSATSANSVPVVIASDQGTIPVGGKTVLVKVNPTNNAGAYSAGNCVGGLLDLGAIFNVVGGTGLLASVVVREIGTQKAPLDLLFFDSQPDDTFTDHSAFPTLDSTDAGQIMGRVSAAAADYITVGGVSVASYSPNLVVQNKAGSAGTHLWLAINTSGTPTFASTTALQIELGFLLDN